MIFTAFSLLRAVLALQSFHQRQTKNGINGARYNPTALGYGNILVILSSLFHGATIGTPKKRCAKPYSPINNAPKLMATTKSGRSFLDKLSRTTKNINIGSIIYALKIPSAAHLSGETKSATLAANKNELVITVVQKSNFMDSLDRNFLNIHTEKIIKIMASSTVYGMPKI